MKIFYAIIVAMCVATVATMARDFHKGKVKKPVFIAVTAGAAFVTFISVIFIITL